MLGLRLSDQTTWLDWKHPSCFCGFIELRPILLIVVKSYKCVCTLVALTSLLGYQLIGCIMNLFGKRASFVHAFWPLLKLAESVD